MGENVLPPDGDRPRRGCLTDAQRAELRRILADEYRGVLNHGEALILDGFIIAQAKVPPAAIEFDFLPDPKANPLTVPTAERDYLPAFVLDLKPDPVAAFVGVLMANPDAAQRVRELMRRLLACPKLYELLGHLYDQPTQAAGVAHTLAQLIDMSEPPQAQG